MNEHERRVSDALEGFRTAESMVASGGTWKIFLGGRVVDPRDFLVERRTAARNAIILAEANGVRCV